MIRGLVVAAVGGAVLSMGCFSVMHALGPVSMTDYLESATTGSHHHGPMARRDIPWQGGTRLEISFPANVIYTQGPAPSISVEGPQDLISGITLSGNVISGTGHQWNWRSGHHDGVTLRITAPAVSDLAISSAASVHLNDIALPELRLSVDGAASITGNGRADRIVLSSDGASSVNLSDMTVKDADISIAGAGSVKVGPTGHASVSIDGVGSVKLTRYPRTLDKHISGVGSVSVPPKPADNTSSSADDDGVSL
ncbi:GIN domain-containing protein [Acetobacter fallax]|uniref:DUF2807 domain-containing protein n=1 Tax=Acetobacter fallax TaxID=1737473 RepID=A0ABX0KFI9_9PROT|nr:DUF2807 domain-containing protein [Acetobacter fallax]NHO33180.1 DUF2807 domain-containing protein [Acetobacter fallax]NHO36799.1 DUF2807 domain-containing protein [Acetobacter fallax]